MIASRTKNINMAEVVRISMGSYLSESLPRLLLNHKCEKTLIRTQLISFKALWNILWEEKHLRICASHLLASMMQFQCMLPPLPDQPATPWDPASWSAEGSLECTTTPRHVSCIGCGWRVLCWQTHLRGIQTYKIKVASIFLLLSFHVLWLCCSRC